MLIFFSGSGIISLHKIFAGEIFQMKNNKIFKSNIDGTLELCGDMTMAEETESAENSFFDRSYFGTRILILAPFAGDELALAGNCIQNFSAAKAEIFIAYSAEKNLSAAAEVLKIFGIPREKILSIGEKNLKHNLKNILLELRANIIFCPDFDFQAEYKILSAAFEEVMGEILSAQKKYFPEVYKKFICATALNAPPDFYAPNLLPTVRPKVGTTDGYNFDILSRANYLWESRVRFPVRCQKSLMKDNPVAAAIFACKSKRNDLNALKILNSDEIFFERNTNNLTYSAKISATSGEPSKVSDFKIFHDFWQPTLDDTKKILSFDWQEPVQVRRIVIYGNPSDESAAKILLTLETDNFRANIDKAGIYLDNTFKSELLLPKFGRPLILDTEKFFVRRAEIRVLESARSFGIAEIEFFSNVEPLRKIQPFIKLTAGENFFYRLVVPLEVEKIPLRLYRFHVDEPVKISAESCGEKILTEIFHGSEELILNVSGETEIILTAEVIGNPNIYDRAIIRRIGDLAQIQLKVWQWVDKIRT